MHWVALLAGSILIVECFLRLPILASAKNMLQIVQQVNRVIFSRVISDHWKERVLPVYAWSMFKNSLRIFLLLNIAIAPMVIIGLLLVNTEPSFFDFLASTSGIIGSTLAVLLYLPLRQHLFHA